MNFIKDLMSLAALRELQTYGYSYNLYENTVMSYIYVIHYYF